MRPVCSLEGQRRPLAWAGVSKFLSPSPYQSRSRIDGQGLPGYQKAGRKGPNFDATEYRQQTGFQPLRKDITKPILQMRETEVY